MPPVRQPSADASRIITSLMLSPGPRRRLSRSRIRRSNHMRRLALLIDGVLVTDATGERGADGFRRRIGRWRCGPWREIWAGWRGETRPLCDKGKRASCAALPAKQSAKEAQEGDADAGKAADEPEPHD